VRGRFPFFIIVKANIRPSAPLWGSNVLVNLCPSTIKETVESKYSPHRSALGLKCIGQPMPFKHKKDDNQIDYYKLPVCENRKKKRWFNKKNNALSNILYIMKFPYQ
jgi:hypothetical protein